MAGKMVALFGEVTWSSNPAFPSARPPARAPLWAPTAPTGPCPSRLFHPTRCAAVSAAGSGGVATRRAAASSHASSCEPPSDQPQEACLPPMSGGVASAGGLAPTVHAPPPLSMRDLTRGKAKDPRAPSVPHRAGQRAALWQCTMRLLQRLREQEQRAPCLRRTCCLACGLSSLSFVGVRIKRPTGRGGMAVRP